MLPWVYGNHLGMELSFLLSDALPHYQGDMYLEDKKIVFIKIKCFC